MMVVKEPQEASEVIKEYPPIQWKTMGLPPLRIALISCVVATAIGGVISNPLYNLANSAVNGTPFLKEAITKVRLISIFFAISGVYLIIL